MEQQLELVEKVSKGLKPDTVVFCSHPPVVTIGRATQPEDIFSWAGETIEVSRGGRATYHGPSQLVIYPIFSLEPKHNVVGFLRHFENIIVKVLASYAIKAVGKSVDKKITPEGLEETGVWVRKQKIASLGLAVKQWTTYHGAALNVHHDPQAFQGLNPCGFKSSVMTSLEEVLQKPIDKSELIYKFQNQFSSRVSY